MKKQQQQQQQQKPKLDYQQNDFVELVRRMLYLPNDLQRIIG